MARMTLLLALCAASATAAWSPATQHRRRVALRRPDRRLATLRLRGGLSVAGVASTLGSTGVQKILELGTIASLGASLRGTLDPAAVTALLLKALVPCVILSSLSALTFGRDLGAVVAAGAALVTVQIAAGAAAARLVVRADAGDARRRAMRRAAALQLGTCAPASSVFAFVREFASPAHVGLAALADMPNKAYVLLGLPKVAELRGDKGVAAAAAVGKPSVRKIITDPFNAGILGGLLLAVLGTPTSSLGFFGAAVASLSAANTPVLFLLIGLKCEITGAAPALSLALLLARHGFVALGAAGFLRAFLAAAAPETRLACVLSSQAAVSVVGYGALARTWRPGDDLDLAFNLVALSFPLTALMNTATCLLGSRYVDRVAFVGLGYLAASAALYLAQKDAIDGC